MSNTIQERGYKVFIIIVDLLIILAAYVAAFYVRYGGTPDRNWDSFISLAPYILLIGFFFLAIYDVYNLQRKNATQVMRSVFVAVIFMAFLTMAASYFFREFALPRLIIVLASIFIFAGLTVFKSLLINLVLQRKKGSVLIIGEDEEVEKVLQQLKHPLLKGTKIKSIHANTENKRIYEVVNTCQNVLVCPSLPKEKKSKILYHAMKNNKVAYVIPSLYELLISRSEITSFDDTMVMSVKPFGLSWDQLFAKRCIDIISSLVILIITSPLFLLAYLLIKLENPKGSVIYSQPRIGKENKEFMIYKFRSMIENAEGATGPVLATENDDRITRAGRFLRATRIDELPQLINVLKGDMSLVGPRPEREFFTKELCKQYKSYSYRSKVKPGITGYAQIMGKYSTNAEDKLRYDLYYIRNFSIWLDITIILRTIIVVFEKEKAEGMQAPQKVDSNSTSVTKDITIHQ